MPLYGGQAVIEGVMMRTRDRAATAVRAMDGSIVVRNMPIRSGKIRSSVRRIPVIRGIVALWDVFALGTRALAFSARVAAAESGPAEADTDGGDFWTSAMMVLGLVLGVGLFFLAPLGITALVDPWVDSSAVSNLIEGFIRVAIVIGYLAAIGFLPDIFRTLQYHGAEHKTVNAVESRIPLTAANVIAQSRFHPRCGTSFILAVVFISIAAFALLGRPDPVLRIASRIVMIPLAAAIAYEVIAFLAARRDRRWAAVLAAPGIWLQRLTTRQPDLAQCAVAIAAIEPVLDRSDRELLVVDPAAPDASAANLEKMSVSTDS